MRLRAMMKNTSLDKQDGQVAVRGPRRWPLKYLPAYLLLLILLPQLLYKAVLQSESFIHTKTIFGDNLLPTPWHWHDNPLGPRHHKLKRSLEVLSCYYGNFIKPAASLLSVSNDTYMEEECPSYFSWIRKDLAPWELTGITSANVKMAREHSAFKLVILNGKLYIESYYSCVQTRAVFTVWGVLLLLEKYNGQVPDVEMMFDCMDRPRIEKSTEGGKGLGGPPPLFRYCSNSNHYDIPWPDWSFWGWSETKLEPWEQELDKIIRGSQKNDWSLKSPKAYWRGNPDVGSPLRMELIKCNNATKSPRTETLNQNWDTELALGKQHSKLENQCSHKYKIYAEGFAWSVSFKYILACGSPTLAIAPAYYDFFMRGLQPWIHYIPVRPSQICAPKLCAAIDKEVKVGESNPLKVSRIGKAGQDFVQKKVSMKNVYDYMFHMISEYAALQRFKPSIPAAAAEITADFILCLAQPHERLLLEQSRRHLHYGVAPCRMSKNSAEELKDYEWEAKEHSKKYWSSNDCVPRSQGKKKHGKQRNSRKP